jgi:hypothetical protein
MKWLIHISALIIAALVIGIAVEAYPRFSNIKAEYSTAQALRDIETYVRENQGQWPSSPEQLKNKYPIGSEVAIDYSATSDELVTGHDKLRNAVHPRSGKFYTYPHYDRQINDLLLVLREQTIINKRTQATDVPLMPEP